MAGQQPYDVGIATAPYTVKFLNSLSLEDRTASLLNLFETDRRYECAWHFTERTACHSPLTLAVYVENAWLGRMTKSW